MKTQHPAVTFAPVVEIGIVSNGEGVHRAICADLPCFSKVGADVEIRVKLDESAEDEFVAGAVGGGGVVISQVGRSAAVVNQCLFQRNACIENRVSSGAAVSKSEAVRDKE